mgnify:CR=1 FL=1
MKKVMNSSLFLNSGDTVRTRSGSKGMVGRVIFIGRFSGKPFATVQWVGSGYTDMVGQSDLIRTRKKL